MKKKLIGILVVAVFGLTLIPFVSAQSQDKPVKMKAIVEKLDYEKRSVQLKGEKGNLVTFKAGNKAKNFIKIKKGDLIEAEFYGEGAFVDVQPVDGGWLLVY